MYSDALVPFLCLCDFEKMQHMTIWLHISLYPFLNRPIITQFNGQYRRALSVKIRMDRGGMHRFCVLVHTLVTGLFTRRRTEAYVASFLSAELAAACDVVH